MGADYRLSRGEPWLTIGRAFRRRYLGLDYSVWTGELRRGIEVASRLEAGTVGVNDGYAAVWSSYDAPMGGTKLSGMGRRHGAEGLLKYTESQTIAVQRLGRAFAPPENMDTTPIRGC